MIKTVNIVFRIIQRQRIESKICRKDKNLSRTWCCKKITSCKTLQYNDKNYKEDDNDNNTDTIYKINNLTHCGIVYKMQQCQHIFKFCIPHYQKQHKVAQTRPITVFFQIASKMSNP